MKFGLLFRWNPFVRGGWIYGRWDGDKFIMRGSLDGTRDDIEEVLRREAEAKPE